MALHLFARRNTVGSAIQQENAAADSMGYRDQSSCRGADYFMLEIFISERMNPILMKVGTSLERPLREPDTPS